MGRFTRGVTRARWAGRRAGPPGPVGPEGPRGPAGTQGSPDTAADILRKLLTVDGANSNLDADTLDGRMPLILS